MNRKSTDQLPDRVRDMHGANAARTGVCRFPSDLPAQGVERRDHPCRPLMEADAGLLPPTLHRLRAALRAYVRTCAPDIDAFCGSALHADHSEKPCAARASPVVSRLPALGDMTVPALIPIVDAIIAASRDLEWRQSYTAADPGIDSEHLANYGWFNVISPSGPFLSEDLRLSVGYWEKGLHYPWHRHEPEEIYLTLAGSAVYRSDGRASVSGGPGTTVCHYSNQWHAIDFPDAPLLAAAFWRGGGLEAKSEIRAQ